MDESLEAHPGAAGHFAAEGAHSAFLGSLLASADTISRATSPGLPCSNGSDQDNQKRYRPRTFSYFRLLPFEVEEESHRDAALNGILKNLYVSIMAEDFSPGAVHWTRELQGSLPVVRSLRPICGLDPLRLV